MAGNHLYNQRVVERWERNMNNPPEDNHYLICECCGEPVWDALYEIDKKTYCEDCAKASFRMWIIEETALECDGCGNSIDDDDCYYEVNGDQYCEKCFSEFFRV